MRLIGKVVVGVLFWSLGLPLVLAGLALRGLYEGMLLGWRMPELVSSKRAVDSVERALRRMDK